MPRSQYLELAESLLEFVDTESIACIKNRINEATPYLQSMDYSYFSKFTLLFNLLLIHGQELLLGLTLFLLF